MSLTCTSSLQIQIKEISHLPVIVLQIFTAHQVETGGLKGYQFLLRLECVVDRTSQISQLPPVLAFDEQNTSV